MSNAESASGTADPAGETPCGHAGTSMDDTARDMRDRFVVALLFAVPIVLWSPFGTGVLGLDLAYWMGLP